MVNEERTWNNTKATCVFGGSKEGRDGARYKILHASCLRTSLEARSHTEEYLTLTINGSLDNRRTFNQGLQRLNFKGNGLLRKDEG